MNMASPKNIPTPSPSAGKWGKPDCGSKKLPKTVEQFQMENLKEYIQGFLTAHFTPVNAHSALDSGTITNGDLHNITQNDLTQLSVNIMFIKNHNALLADKSSQLKNKASQFIRYLNKEFGLKNKWIRSH